MSVRTSWRVAAVLALVTLLAHLSVLALGETWFLRDHLPMTLPWRRFVAETLAAGRWPEWWDAIGLGVPVAGNPLFGVGYPPSWALALAPRSGWAVDAFMVAHVWLGGLGAARLSRRLGAAPLGQIVGGSLFALSGYTTSMVVMGLPLLALAWAPHALCAADDVARAGTRRDRLRATALAAPVLALLLMAGDPAAVITTALAALALLLARAPRGARLVGLGLLAGAGVAALCMAALALLPALAFQQAGARSGGIPVEQATVWSLHPLRTIELFWPSALGDATDQRLNLARLVADGGRRGGLDASWALGLYIGLPALLLAGLAARRSRAHLALALAGLGFLLLALGEHTPLYRLYRAVMLPEQLVRYPERHLAGALLLWAPLAGAGFTALFAGAGEDRRARRALAIATAALAALLLAALLLRGALADALAARAPGGPPPVDVSRALAVALAGGRAALGATALLAAAALLAARRPAARWPAPLAALVIAGHALAESAPLLPTIERAALASPPAWLREPLSPPGAAAAGVPRDRLFRDRSSARVPLGAGPAERVLVEHETLADRSAAMTLGLAETPGYNPLADPRQRALWEHASGPALSRLLDLYDVRWVLLDAADARARGLRLRARQQAQGPGGAGLFENAGRRPRGFVASRWSFVDGDEAAREAVLDPKLDYHSVRIDGTSNEVRFAVEPLTPCEIERPRPEVVRQRCVAPTEGYAVLLDAWAPGWSVTVDRRPARAERADALVRAVWVAPGAHEIEWRYRAPGFSKGLWISLVVWLLWLGAAAALFRQELVGLIPTRSP